jgi:ketosteroid isomerase-like protein
MTMPAARIEAVLKAYGDAVLAKDVDAFVALYDLEVEVFDAWGTWSYRGVAAWRRMVADWFGSLGSERVLVAATEVRAAASTELAMLNAAMTYRSVSVEGKELHAMTNRLTWGLRRQGDAWRIVHEHTSVPVEFSTGKAIFHH